jgi:hypothetical protein
MYAAAVGKVITIKKPVRQSRLTPVTLQALYIKKLLHQFQLVDEVGSPTQLVNTP